MSLNLKEIWKLQGELNVLIGRDTINDPEKEKWVFDYAVALHDEATELFNCCSWKWWSLESKQYGQYKLIDVKNAKIEAIDCLHFLISLMQVLDYDISSKEDDFNLIWTQCINLSKQDEDFKKISVYLIHNSVDLMKIDSFNIDDLLTVTMFNLLSMFVNLDFEKGDLLKIYKMKHEKNVLRQKNGYSVINKTEADNNEIKENI